MIKVVEGAITEDKFFNVLKGRRLAAEENIWGMKEIDSMYKERENLKEDESSSYYKENLPELIENLKTLFRLNLEVIDIDLDTHYDDFAVISSCKEDLSEMFGPQIVSAILKNANRNMTVTEDKLHNVVKSRKTAAQDSKWAMRKIDELIGESKSKGEPQKPKSWSVKSAEENE